MRWGKLLGLAAVPSLVHSLASTDSIQDVDTAQSGYLPTHNVDPSSFANYGIIWKMALSALETIYAKPLTYTPDGYTNELVITASNKNILRIHDGLTGALVGNRTLDPPFQAVDTSCGDIMNYLGVIGTPIIDPATSIMYFFSKGYKGAVVGPAGTLAGQYKFYAVNIPSLTDVPGFPIILEGKPATNDPTRYFVGGVVVQRPSLTMIGDSVIGAFGGQCDNFNYTGMLVTVSKTSGVGVTNIYAMEASPGAPSPQPLNYLTQNGGKAGIWMSGAGMPTLGNQIYFVTGNGQGAENGGVPASGRSPLSTIDQCVANFAVDPATGKLGLTDYFEPYEYVGLNGGDRDFGSGGSALLDPATFSGTGVDRIIVAGGKTGKLYIMNADNLGGFSQGPGGSDAVLQTIQTGNSFFNTPGSYPLEGGYIYFNPIGLPLYAYKFGLDTSGKPVFTLAGQTALSFAGGSSPVVTTLNGQAGTGVVWMTDTNKGVVAYKAVPVGGVLQPITMPAVGGITKYQRAVFGNNRLYTTGLGYVMALGGPVTLPLQCASPVNLGSLNVGSTTTATITCTAKTALTLSGCTTSLGVFKCDNTTLPSSVASGASFSFPLTWDLTPASVSQAQTKSKVQITPGTEIAALNLYTNSISGYSSLVPIKLQGTVGAPAGYLSVNATQVDFGGIALGGPYSTSSRTILLTNKGTSPLTFTGFAWQDMNANGSPYNNVTVQATSIVGNGFTATKFPALGSTLAGGSSITIPLTFSSPSSAQLSSLLSVWSDGGWIDVLLSGTAANANVATLAISDGQGNWVSNSLSMAFGNVLAKSSATRQIRICNTGASPLTITVSTPPVGQYLTVLDPQLDLLQGSLIAAGSCSFGTVEIIAASLQPNHAALPLSGQWILNTNGINQDGTLFGLQTISISATIVSRQVGPLEPNGQGIYQFYGCFNDNTRNLPTSTSNNNNSIEACLTSCNTQGYAYAGLEYHTICYCGNTFLDPTTLVNEKLCNFNCPGDATEVCGGNGAGNGGYLYAYYNQNKVGPLSTSSSKISTSTAFTTSSSSSSSASSSSSFAITTSKSSSSVTSSSSSSSAPISTSSSKSSTSSSSSKIPSSSSSSSSASSSSSSSSSSAQITSSSSSRSSVATSISSSSSSSSIGQSSTSASSSSSSLTSSLSSSSSSSLSSSSSSSTVTSSSSSSPASTTSSSSSSAPASSSSSSSAIVTSSSTSSASTTSSSSSAAPTTTLIGGFSYVGCYSDNVNDVRTFPYGITAADTMSLEACAQNCANYEYFGTEYGRECYCGYTLDPTLKAPEADCDVPCAGNPSEICGHGSRLSSYQNSVFHTALQPPSHVSTVSGYTSLSCYTEGSASRALIDNTYADGASMTIESCSNYCLGYQYFGVEFSSECYCGNVLQPGSIPAPLTDCSMVCDGNSSEYCGGSARLELFILSSLVSSSSSSAAASSTSSSKISSSSSISITSSSSSYSSAAASTSSSATTSPSSSVISSTSSSQLSSTSSKPATSTSSVSSTAGGSSSSVAVSSWSSSASSSTSSQASSSISTQTSWSSGYSATTSSSSSSTISSSSSVVTSSSSSSINQSSSTSQTKSLSSSSQSQSSSVVQTSSSSSLGTSSSSETTQQTSSSNSATTTSVAPTLTATTSSNFPVQTAFAPYVYQGCYRDIAKGHALPLLASNSSMTPELCSAIVASLASKPTPTFLPYFAVEYRKECYGGSAFTFGTSTITSLYGAKACTDVCSGSIGAVSTGTAKCGGSKQFDLYAYSGTVTWPASVTTASV